MGRLTLYPVAAGFGRVAAREGLADVTLWGGIADLPMFSPDAAGPPAPARVEALLAAIAAADAVVIAAPEYVHAIPRGLKNAIDRCVSRPELIGKPVAVLHASPRGDDMGGSCGWCCNGIQPFCARVFLRVPLAAVPDTEGDAALTRAAPDLAAFLADLSEWVRQT